MSYTELIKDAGPVAYWKLDETSGTTAVDEMGNHNGTYINSPTLGQPPGITTGTSVEFNGTSQRVSVNAATVGNGGNDWTFEAWVKTTNTAAGAVLMGVGHKSTSSPFIVIQVNEISSGDMKVAYRSTTSTVEAATFTDTGWLDGNWHHIVGLRSGSTLRIYVDAVEKATGTISVNGSTNVFDVLNIMALERTTVGFWFEGTVDEPAVYDYALTASEIQYHYDVGVGNEVYPPITDAEIFPTFATMSLQGHAALVEIAGDATIQPATAELQIQTLSPVLDAIEDVPQVVRPMDPHVGNWVRSDSSVTHAGHINDDSTSRYLLNWRDNNRNSNLGRTSTFALPFSRPTNISDPFTVTYSYRHSPEGTYWFGYTRIEILDADGTIRAWRNAHTNSSNTVQSFSLTANEKSNIVDWGGLQLRLISVGGSAGIPVGTAPYQEVRFNWLRAEAGAVYRQNAIISPDTAELTFAADDASLIDDRSAFIAVGSPAEMTFTTHNVPPPGSIVRAPKLLRPVSLRRRSRFQKSNTNWEWHDLVNQPGVLNRYVHIDYPGGGAPAESGYVIFNLTPTEPSFDLNLPHKIRIELWRPAAPDGGIPVFSEAYATLYSGEKIIYFWSLGSTWDGYRTSELNLHSHHNKPLRFIDDWNDLRLEVWAGSNMDLYSGTFRVISMEMEVPNFDGFISVEPAAAELDITTHAPEITAFSTIPDPGKFDLQTHDPEVFPAIPEVLSTALAVSSSPFLRVLDHESQSLEQDWPSANLNRRSVAIGANSQYLAIADSDRNIAIINAETKEWVRSVSSPISRDITALAVAPDSNLLAVGYRQRNDSDHIPGPTTTTAFRLYSIDQNSWVGPTPNITGMTNDIAFSGDGKWMAVATNQSPFLQVVDTNNMSVDSSWDDVPGAARSVAWLGNDLMVAHPGGYSVIRGKGVMAQQHWPSISPHVPDAIAVRMNKVAMVANGKLFVMDLNTKNLMSDFPPLNQHTTGLSWVTDNVVAVSAETLTRMFPEVEIPVQFVDVNTKSFAAGWPSITSWGVTDVTPLGSQVAITPPPPPPDVTIQVGMTNASMQTFASIVEVVQEIQAPEATFELQTHPAEVSAPDITIHVGVANISMQAMPPQIFPVDTTSVVTNTPQALMLTLAPTIVSVASDFKLIPIDSIHTTARDAEELQELDMGAVLHGSNTMVGFRVGNVHDEVARLMVRAVGDNQPVVEAVSFSWDKENFSEDLTMRIPPNGISDVIYMKVEIPAGAPNGDCTFLINVENVITT